jgi:probable O-glycosylation ligase (exosortase A-associated)
VYGPPGSQYGDNNEFAIAVTMTIPLLVLWRHEARDKTLRWVIAGAIVLSYAAVLSSWSRGALLSLTAVTLLLVWHSRRKLLFLPLLVLAVALVFISLPETWFSRMETIVNFQHEGSAQGRLEVWKIALDLVREQPVFGGGFEGWIYATLSTGGSRDWHNAYLEMATEHGLVGLGLWALLLFGSMASLTRLIMQAQSRKLEWVHTCGAMLRTSLAGYAVGAIFLGIAYWELLYWLIGATVIFRHLARQSLCQAKPSYPSGALTAPAI